MPRPAKWLATGMIAISAVSLLVVAPPGWTSFVLGGIACVAAVLVWLWRRPEHRPPEPPAP